jgi:hypothetical protein
MKTKASACTGETRNFRRAVRASTDVSVATGERQS